MIKENLEPSKRGAWEGGDGGGRWSQVGGAPEVLVSSASQKAPRAQASSALVNYSSREAHLTMESRSNSV